MRRRHAVEPVLLLRHREPAGLHQLVALVGRLILGALGALGKLGAVFRIVQELLGLFHGKYSNCAGRRKFHAAIQRNFCDHFATLMNACSRWRCCKFNTTGKSRLQLSSPSIKNISLYQNYDLRYQSRRPVPTEGRFAIVTIRRVRMRWTLWRQVWQRDPGKVGNRFSDKDHAQTRHTGRKRCSVRRSRVVLAPRPWRYVGGNPPPATGARKAASPGRSRISRKAIA